jgi:hypothetical protein
VRNAQRVDAAGYVRHNAVDLGVGIAGTVDGPRREDVAEAVELTGRAKDLDDLGVLGGRTDVVLKLVPKSLTVTLDDRGVLRERPLDAANEAEDVVHALRLWLCVPDQRRAQTPIVRTAAFREVDQTGKCWRLDFGWHLIAA